MLKAATMILPLILAVSLHEAAHGWVADKSGDDTARRLGRITLNPLKHIDPFGSVILPMLLIFTGSSVVFGYARPVPVNFSRLRNGKKGVLAVSAAGIVVNLILLVVSGVAFRILYATSGMWENTGFYHIGYVLLLVFGQSCLINMVLAVFNMVPIPPLDGGRILGVLLPESQQRAFARLERYGMIIVILLLVTRTLGKILWTVGIPMLQLAMGKNGLWTFFRLLGDL